jgi:hypothetical protein
MLTSNPCVQVPSDHTGPTTKYVFQDVGQTRLYDRFLKPRRSILGHLANLLKHIVVSRARVVRRCLGTSGNKIYQVSEPSIHKPTPHNEFTLTYPQTHTTQHATQNHPTQHAKPDTTTPHTTTRCQTHEHTTKHACTHTHTRTDPFGKPSSTTGGATL